MRFELRTACDERVAFFERVRDGLFEIDIFAGG